MLASLQPASRIKFPVAPEAPCDSVRYKNALADRSGDRRYRPATATASATEIEDTLSFARRFKGRKRSDTVDPMIAQIAASHLREVLKHSGAALMKRPDHSAPRVMPRRRRPSRFLVQSVPVFRSQLAQAACVLTPGSALNCGR
jgi:hypothetical protein